jgi:5-methylcytosine-specific restriction endonuclease McrA
MLDRNTALRVYVRDCWRCRHCKSRGPLHPHHLKYKSQGGGDELSNLITLCFICHRAHHDGLLTIDVIGVTLNMYPEVKFTRNKGWRPK